MKSVALTLALILTFCFTAFQANISLAEESQEAILKEIETSRTIGRERWKELVELNMNLSDDEAKVFWPIYEDYRTDMTKVNDRLLELTTTYADSYTKNNLTDEAATKLIKDYLSIEKDKLKIREKYSKKLEKVLPAKRVMRFIQVENKLTSLVNAGLALQIPLAE